MYLRIVNLKFASEIEADAMHAFAEYELLDKLPGILSIEVVRITNYIVLSLTSLNQKKMQMSLKE